MAAPPPPPPPLPLQPRPAPHGRLSARLGGKLRSQRRFALGDSQAVEFVLDVPRTTTTEGYTIKGRIYVRHAGGGKDTLYQTLVTGKPGVDKAADTTRFLESFRF